MVGRNWIQPENMNEEEAFLESFIAQALPEEELRPKVSDEVENYLSMFLDHVSADTLPKERGVNKETELSGVEISRSVFLSGFSEYVYSTAISSVRISTACVSQTGMHFYMPDTTLICYTLSGEGDVYAGGKSYRCRKYDCVCVNCEERPIFRAHPGEPWEGAFIRISGKLQSDLYYELCNCIRERGVALMTFGAGTRFRSLIWDLISDRTENSIYNDMLYNHLLLSLLLELDMTVTLSMDKPSIIPNYILDIQRYLDNNYSRDINLDMLAKIFNISKYHMSREFKKNIGKSPIDYLIDVRISRAKALLYESDRSISSICNLVGIPNPNHFLYLFKEREGITPSAFRKFKL